MSSTVFWVLVQDFLHYTIVRTVPYGSVVVLRALLNARRLPASHAGSLPVLLYYSTVARQTESRLLSLTGNGAPTQVCLTGLSASALPSTLNGNNNNNTSVSNVVYVPASSGGSTATSTQNNSTNDNEDVPAGPNSTVNKHQDESDKDEEEDSHEDVIRPCWC